MSIFRQRHLASKILVRLSNILIYAALCSCGGALAPDGSEDKPAVSNEVIGFNASYYFPTKADAYTSKLNSFLVYSAMDGAEYFSGLNVNVDNSNNCTASETYYWPVQFQTNSFLAYGFSDGTDDGAGTAYFPSTGTLSISVTEPRDLMYASATDVERGNPVPLNFSHAMAQIEFEAKLKETGTPVNISSITMPVWDHGTFELSNSNSGWSDRGDKVEKTLISNMTVSSTEPASLGAFLLFPEANDEFSEDKIVITFDDGRETEISLSDTYVDGFEAGHKYKISLTVTPRGEILSNGNITFYFGDMSNANGDPWYEGARKNGMVSGQTTTITWYVNYEGIGEKPGGNFANITSSKCIINGTEYIGTIKNDGKNNQGGANWDRITIDGKTFFKYVVRQNDAPVNFTFTENTSISFIASIGSNTDTQASIQVTKTALVAKKATMIYTDENKYSIDTGLIKFYVYNHFDSNANTQVQVENARNDKTATKTGNSKTINGLIYDEYFTETSPVGTGTKTITITSNNWGTPQGTDTVEFEITLRAGQVLFDFPDDWFNRGTGNLKVFICVEEALLFANQNSDPAVFTRELDYVSFTKTQETKIGSNGKTYYAYTGNCSSYLSYTPSGNYPVIINVALYTAGLNYSSESKTITIP